MDLQASCTIYTSLFRLPPLNRRLPSRNATTHSNSLKFRRKMITSELPTPVRVTNGNRVYSPSIPTHKVTVHDRQRGVVHEFSVPEDQYILHTAEDQNISLPFACRHGSEGHMAEETKFINLSLTSLGKCINALAENSPHIPTRDSKLTRYLQKILDPPCIQVREAVRMKHFYSNYLFNNINGGGHPSTSYISSVQKLD